MTAPRTFRIRGEHDVAEVTRAARDAALALGLGRTEAVQLATAVSEVAGNQVRHAGGGTVTLGTTARGVAVDARDDGPGIADVALALTDGYSTGDSLGLGLPGARRLVDEFSIVSRPGRGTRVRLLKWSPALGATTAPEELAAWAVAANPAAAASAVAQGFPGGLLLAVARRGAEALRARPAAPPAALVEACGGRDVAVAVLGRMDGQLVWQAEPAAGAMLRRERRASSRSHVVLAPSGRGATVGMLRDDLLVLASFAPTEAGAPAGAPREVAVAVAAQGPPDAVVLAARVRRGVLERRPRR